MKFRVKTQSGLGELKAITVTIGQIEKSESSVPFANFRCVVTTGPSPIVSNEVSGRDTVGTLIAALGAVNAYCQMLHHIGELRLESGELYDPDADGIQGICKRAQRVAFPPSFVPGPDT
ncbi:MAG: hypothetical protein JWQ01_3712 [Massilia sp.]|nr:hypothetical protein [Massilia sp.]